MRPWATCSAWRAMSRRWASVAAVNLLRRTARASACRCASAGPAALSAVWRTGLVLRCATGAVEPGEVTPRPPWMGGDRGVPAAYVAASCWTLEVVCWCLVGSKVGGASKGRMPSGRRGSGHGSDGVGETLTAPAAGPLWSSVASPKCGASTAAGLGVHGELEELVCL